MKIEALVELVRTLGDSVQQLSALLENVPKVVDTKLASMRESLLGDLAAMRGEVGAMRAGFGELQGDAGALLARFDTTSATLKSEFAQIIADNRAEYSATVQAVQGGLDEVRQSTKAGFDEVDARCSILSQSISGVETTAQRVFAESLEKTATMVGEVRANLSKEITVIRDGIEDVDTRTKAKFMAVGQGIAEVRTACDTTDLHHTVTTLKAQVATGEEGRQHLEGMVGTIVADLAGTNSFVKDIAKQVADNETVVIDWQREGNERVAKVEETLAGRSAFFDLLGQNVDKLFQTTTGLENHLDEMEQESAKVFSNVLARCTGVEQAFKDETATLAKSLESTIGIVKNMGTRIEEVVQNYNETVATAAQHYVDVTARCENSDQAVVSLGEELRAADAAIVKKVEEVITLVADHRKALDATIADTAARLHVDVSARCENTDQAVALLGTELRAADTAITKGVEEVITIVAENHKATITSIADTTRHAAETRIKLDNLATATITDIEQSVAELGAELRVATKANAENVIVATRHIDGGLQRVDERVTRIEAGTAESVLDLNERAARMAVDLGGITERVGTLEKIEVPTREQIQQAVDKVHQLVNDGMAESVQDMAERVNGVSVQLAATNQVTADLTNRVDGLEKREVATPADLEKLNKTLVDSITQTEEHIHKNITDISMTLRGTMNDQHDRLVDTIATTSKSVDERFAALPGPFDPAPLKADLQAWIGDKLVENRPPEMSFDVGVSEDKSLVFTLKQGEQEITRNVALNVGIEYRGVFEREEAYEIGNFVTHQGSMWFAKTKPVGEPGKADSGWQLAVKRGRDGKNATPARINHVRDPDTGLIKESRFGYDSDDETTNPKE